MQKKITLFFIISLFSICICAQTKIIDSLTNWVKDHPVIDSQYIITLHRISYRLSENDVKKSFVYYEKVVAISDSLNFTYGKSLAQINLGILLYNSANFDASNKAFFKAVDYAEACGALRLKAVSLNNIGDNFKTLKDYDRSRQYAREAIAINTKIQAWRGVALNYELLQQSDLEEKLYKQAKENLLQGMPFAIRSNDSYALSQFYLGFGKLQAIDNNTDSAVFYFNEAMHQAKLQNDLRNQFQVYLAETIYLKNIPILKKIVLLDSALNIARQTSYIEGVSDAAEQLSKAYDEAENKDSSLFYYRLYRRSADSLFSENNKRNVIIKESEWMIKRKEIENKHLLALSELQHKDLSIKNSLLIAVLISLLLAIVIGFFIYRNAEAREKRSEATLKQKIAEIKMQVLRTQMNPHFIFNSLNSIENFMMQNEKRLASDYLNKFTRLIRTILDSSLNELIPVAKDMEALQLYIDLQQLRFNNKFTYKTFIHPLILNGDYKVPSLIIQPFVENAIEHGIAHSERTDCTLSVSATINSDHLLYVIEDNGIGRHQSAAYNEQNKRQHKSLGIAITEDRIRIFNGTVKGDSDIVITDLYGPNNEPIGTRVDVKIKLV
jgi:two-component sensor histidine kinase